MNMNTDDYLQDAQGRFVPKHSVGAARIMEDTIVNELFDAGKALGIEITVFKNSAFTELEIFMELLAEQYQITRGGSKGNVTFTNFSGTKRIIISVQDYIAFGAELEIAKDLVDQCIRTWLESGANKEIAKLVTHAFRVDNGRINVREVLRLKQIQIEDDTWKQAMKAIDDAIRVDRSKKYIRFQSRPSSDAEWKTLPLDIAKV